MCQASPLSEGKNAASGPRPAAPATRPPLSRTGSWSRSVRGIFSSTYHFFRGRPGASGERQPVSNLPGAGGEGRGRAPVQKKVQGLLGLSTVLLQGAGDLPVPRPGSGRAAPAPRRRGEGGEASRVRTRRPYSRRAVSPPGRSICAEGSWVRHRSVRASRWAAEHRSSPPLARASRARTARTARGWGSRATSSAGRERVPSASS